MEVFLAFKLKTVFVLVDVDGWKLLLYIILFIFLKQRKRFLSNEKEPRRSLLGYLW
jgi:hypothetical protein